MEDENDDVGGSGGRNDVATIMKWKRMMSTPASRVKTKFKSRSKPKKKFAGGAKSGNGKGLGIKANLGKTVSSHLSLRRSLSPEEMGNSRGSSNVQRCRGIQNFNLSYHNLRTVKTIFEKGNKSETF